MPSRLTIEEVQAAHKLTRFERMLETAGRALARVVYFKRTFRTGKAHGYPLCCVAHFAWDVSNTRKRLYPAKRRGGIYHNGVYWDVYVPCGLHTRRGPHWRSWGERSPRQLPLFRMKPSEKPKGV